MSSASLVQSPFGQGPAHAGARPEPWKVMIVDDDDATHAVTKLALEGFSFRGREIAYLDAFSGTQAVQLMREHPDTALVLMDVVMETDTAGLDAAQRIREELGNALVRIAVRTGQPGVLPEQAIVSRYGVDDYREKTQLTATRLYTLVHTSLAHYEQLHALEKTRAGLRKVVDATAAVFQLQTVAAFGEGALEQLGQLLYGAQPPAPVAGLAVVQPDDGPASVVAALGTLASRIGDALDELPDAPARERIRQALQRRSGGFDAHYFTGHFRTQDGDGICLYLSSPSVIPADNLGLAVLFARNVTAAIETRHLERERDRAQSEMLVTLSEAIEARSRETGNHVRRVAEYSRLLGQLAGLDSRDTHLLFLAAPLHDAGKIAIPDAILNKPGEHTAEESAIMRSHAELGRRIFTKHDSPVLRAAAVVAGQHHERWDGQGYPQGLRGEAIHLFGRITALADVFDALTNPRCYKDAWPMHRALDYLVQQGGARFDPKLVELFLQHVDQFLEIHERLRDPVEAPAEPVGATLTTRSAVPLH
jgi:response regulator RpfG family c-di-GMP phosphodiesterase